MMLSLSRLAGDYRKCTRFPRDWLQALVGLKAGNNECFVQHLSKTRSKKTENLKGVPKFPPMTAAPVEIGGMAGQ